MEVFHLLWDLFAPRIWDCSTTRLTYITEQKDIIDLLKKGTEELISISEDVKVRLQVAEQQGLVLRVQVTGWLKNVETVEVEVNEILQQAEALDEKWPSPRMYRSAYKLGKKASKTLITVKELITKGEFQEVAIKPVQSLDQVVSTQMEGFCVMPMENTVGMESILSTVLKHLQDDTIGIIGLFGMGGVGKTTLLKRINNQLLGWHHVIFDAAIWVVASKLATVEAIQQSILEKLEIPFETWRNKPMSVKSALIYQILSVKKYILLLDDVWESLDLSEVGIPLPNNINKCKLIFSTRSEEICGLMGAQLKIRVACLPWKKSWDLFQEKVGRATLDSHYEIQGLAVKVAEQCDGLPLALITVGRAMASRKTPNEWSHALRVLRNYPDRFPRMVEHVLPIMKFSYDSLPCPIMKECFLYCSLFPEDIEIPINKLVNLWRVI